MSTIHMYVAKQEMKGFPKSMQDYMVALSVSLEISDEEQTYLRKQLCEVMAGFFTRFPSTTRATFLVEASNTHKKSSRSKRASKKQ